MRILLLIDSYLPSSKAGGKLIHDLGVEFNSRGHQVTVLTPSPAVTAPVTVTNENGLRVIRVKTGRIKGTPKPVRAFQEMNLSRTLWRKARRHLISDPADLIIFYAPTIFWSPLVKRLKSLWNCPAYLILRDIFPQWAVDIGILRRGLVWRYLRKQEMSQYAVADVIAVQSKGDLQYFAANFPERRFKLEVLRNWAAPPEIIRPSEKFRTRLNLRGKTIFIYGGNMGVAQDMDNLLRLADNVAGDPRIHFLFVGEGSEVSRMKNSIAGGVAPNITILPPLGQRDFLSLVSECDAGLISLDRRLKTQNVPGKLLSYLQSSLPTLASVNPGSELFELLQESGAGFCFLNGDDPGLSAAAIRLANDAALRSLMGLNALQLLRKAFSAEVAANTILRNFSVAAVIAESQSQSVQEIAHASPDLVLARHHTA